MANHVTSFVSFSNISEEAIKFLDGLSEIDGENKEQDQIKYFCEDYKPEWDWYAENIGPKWMYFDYVDGDNFSTVSAWSVPIPFFNKVFETLKALNSPDLRMWVQYEDEMPNFVGVYGLYQDEVYEEEVEAEDYMNVIGCENWDEETDDYNEDWGYKLGDWFAEQEAAFLDD